MLQASISARIPGRGLPSAANEDVMFQNENLMIVASVDAAVARSSQVWPSWYQRC